MQSIHQHIQINKKQLSTLINNRKRLEQLLKNIKYKTQKNQTFTQKKHHLSWPIHGKIEQHFGDNIGIAHMQTEAMILAGEPMQLIHAIAAGTVVFSGKLTGYGSMVIINHGQNYFSIYGYSNKINVKRGQHLTKGEVIGTVGVNPSNQKYSLYFGMRHGQKAINPSDWCHRL